MEHFGKVITVFNYFWVLNRQGSEYALGSNYGRILNIPGLRVCQVSAYVQVMQGSEYARIWLQ